MAWEKRDLFQDFLRDISQSLEEYSDEECTEELNKSYLIHLKPTECADYRIIVEGDENVKSESENGSCSNSSKTTQLDNHGKANSDKIDVISSGGNCSLIPSDTLKINGDDGTESETTNSSENSDGVSDPSELNRTSKTKLRVCQFCKQTGYILENGLTKIRFIDHLDSRELYAIFSAVEEPWVVSSVRVRSGGHLDELPKAVSRFNNLTTLTVRRNQLKDLPMSLKKLTHLRTLDVAHNNFDEVPPVIFCIKLLMNVNLKNNNIRFISSAVLDLRHLKTFDVSLNPMISPPRHICDKGIEAIVEQIQSFSKKRLKTYILQKQ